METTENLQKHLSKGWINFYRKKMPWPEVVFKDLFFFFKNLKLFILNGFRKKVIYCYPEFPSRNATLYKIATHLGYSITNKAPSQYDLLAHWEDKTIRHKDPMLEKLATKLKILNGEATNISKDLVDLAHLKAFGYATVVDPKSYHGKCVKKSNENAAHDGMVVECPVQHPEKGVIYQKLINNLTDDHFAEDIRVPVIGDEIPHVYLKYKPLDRRFANFRETERDKPTQIKKTHDILSDSEINSILNLANAMHLDFGEMDALRNRDDGKIYVVDVNNTPTGPSHLTKKDLKLALSNLSESFRKQFL
ncbi:MAG TPA: hypothetical protein VJ939_02690 [Bacteroidales bacterium]|nr:hypothetical protein [Bacteroidales bacterium]